MPLLLSVTHTHPDWAPRRFPFTVPSIDSLASLDLDAPVVCFVGENGSGKSTLLEAIAIAANLPSAGSHDLARRDPTLEQQELLARALTLSWHLRTNRGLFLRAEDFFGFQLLLKRERAEFSDTLERMNEEYADRSDYARTLATGPVRASMAEMDRRYGVDPDARSHGEAFLSFFQQRLVPKGLTGRRGRATAASSATCIRTRPATVCDASTGRRRRGGRRGSATSTCAGPMRRPMRRSCL